MLMESLKFGAGLLALIGGADALVRGASRLAQRLGVSPLVVGLTIVALGTSSPEIAVSVGAALAGNADIAVGNVVGSNVLNVLLILGVSALIAPLLVHSQVIRQEVPIMIGTAMLLLVLALDGSVARGEAALLLVLAVAYATFLLLQSRHEVADVREQYRARMAARRVARGDWALQVLLVVVGLGLLVLGASWLVDASGAFARALGVSDVVIALTIVAAGTSLPEVATSIVAAVRGQRDIAVGNVVGSNILNVLACLGLAGLVSPVGLQVAPSIMHFDMWVMIAVTLTCVPVFVSGREISRWEGAVLLAYYVAYVAYVGLGAQGHDALEAYSAIMLGFVIPLTIVGLVAAFVYPRSQPARR